MEDLSGEIEIPITVLFARLPKEPIPTQTIVSNLLDPQEQKRLANFVFLRDKWRFILGRSLIYFGLRTIFKINGPKLYLDELGRPYSHETNMRGIDFNLSHAGDWICCAFSQFSQLGVDIVDLRDFDEWQSFIASILTWDERENINSLSCNIRKLTVARYWSIKEAVLKCTGMGLQIDPLNIVIDLHSVRQPRVIQCPVSTGARPEHYGVRTIQYQKNTILSVVSKRRCLVGGGDKEMPKLIIKCISKDRLLNVKVFT